MAIESLKSNPADDIDWDNIEDWDDEEAFENSMKKDKKTMKNIFIDTKIKKRSFTKDLVGKLKFANITPFMKMEEATEGYLGAYSESEFYAYRYQKVHGMYPDLLRIRYVNTEKFLTEFFKMFNPPNTSLYKSYEDQRGETHLNLLMIAFDTGRDDPLYMYVDSDEAIFYYNSVDEKDPDSTIHLLISLLKGCIESATQKNKIYVVYQGQAGFEKTGFDVKKIKVDLDDNYNDGFPEVSAEIVKGLNDKKKSNLVILRGSPGTGKTTYIRYLTSKIKKNIIFISPDMVDHITDPSFIPFLIKNSDAVLIIEDGEPAVGERDVNGRTDAVSNILNLTDGLLSDCLNISIVVTLNTDNKDIDPALERKGRLLKHYTFEKLSQLKSIALLNKLGTDNVEVKGPMSLADIYYYRTENGKGQTERRKVGFGN